MMADMYVNQTQNEKDIFNCFWVAWVQCVPSYVLVLMTDDIREFTVLES